MTVAGELPEDHGEAADSADSRPVHTRPLDSHPVLGDPVWVDTVIVGAGFGGLGMGIRLARQNASFLILERGSQVGGTWRDNSYPGVACDIPSHLYSYSFRPKFDWSRFFAPGAEILEYLRDCVKSEGLAARLRLNSDVLEMRWQPVEQRWRVTTDRGVVLCRTLIVAAGRLSTKRMPPIRGVESFTGRMFHSSEWPADLDLAGARVGVVGSGASAVQLIPAVAKTASSVVVFQRSAPYVVPRPDSEYSENEIFAFGENPERGKELRSQLFWEAERAFAERLSVPGFIDRLRARSLAHLAGQITDDALRAQLTPHYEIGCKRVVLSNDYFPAIAAETSTLEPSALVAIEDGRAMAASGALYELDVLVFATGFESTSPPFAERVFGRDGRLLAEEWSAGMTAFASTTVAGFPNLFVIDGPNASLGHNSAVYMIEAQIEYILGALEFQRDAAEPVLEVSRESQDAWVAEIDERSANTVWLRGGCDSWYVDERSRRLTLIWPDFAFSFRERLRVFDPRPYLLGVRAVS